MIKEKIELNILKKLSFSQKESLLFFYNSNFPLSKWSDEYFESFLSSQNKPICIQLQKSDLTLGFVLGKQYKKSESIYILSSLVVDEKFRGNGYGALLVKEFLREAFKVKNVVKVVIHYRESKKLQGFYERIGFKGHAINGFYKNGENKHYMEILRNDIICS